MFSVSLTYLATGHVTLTTTLELEATVSFQLTSDYQALEKRKQGSKQHASACKVRSLHSLPMLCMQEVHYSNTNTQPCLGKGEDVYLERPLEGNLQRQRAPR